MDSPVRACGSTKSRVFKVAHLPNNTQKNKVSSKGKVGSNLVHRGADEAAGGHVLAVHCVRVTFRKEQQRRRCLFAMDGTRLRNDLSVF